MNDEYIAFQSIISFYKFEIQLRSIKASIACNHIFGQIKAADIDLHEHCVLHCIILARQEVPSCLISEAQ